MTRDRVELAIDASMVGHALIAICIVKNGAHRKYCILCKCDHIHRSKNNLKSTIASIGLIHIIYQHIIPNIPNIISPMFHHNLINDFFQEFSHFKFNHMKVTFGPGLDQV